MLILISKFSYFTMLRSLVLFCCVFLAALTPYLAYAMTEEQKAAVHAHFEEVGALCMTEHPITGDDIGNFHRKEMGTSENAPCFVACIMKKIGVMDDKGMLQKDTDLEIVRKVFNDPEEEKSVGDFLHSCSHVNDNAVGGGDKGCERATLAFNCMVENASKFGFDI